MQLRKRNMSKEEIRALLNDIESDRVERTVSTTNTDKFRQAICAFANDLPDYRLPGYLFLGVKDDGEVQGLHVTDELLKNVAAIRTDGNIQPQPSMAVEKVSMEEGDIVMVKVEPSVFPPVRYKGRIWIRIGPRKGVANENGEAIYDFAYQTAVLVMERKSPRGERMVKVAIANGFLQENGQKPSEERSNVTLSDGEQTQKQPNLSVSEENQTQKQPNLSISDFPSMLTWNVYEAIKMNRKAKYSWLADNLGVSERTIQRAIDDLKELGYINKEHSKIKGEWQLSLQTKYDERR